MLSKKQIEAIAAPVRSTAFEDVPCATITPKELRTLCDMALSAPRAEPAMPGEPLCLRSPRKESNPVLDAIDREVIREYIDTLRAHALSLAADGERYRWLRVHSWIDISIIKSVLNFGPGYQQTQPEILDANIDAAIDREGGGNDEQL